MTGDGLPATPIQLGAAAQIRCTSGYTSGNLTIKFELPSARARIAQPAT